MTEMDKLFLAIALVFLNGCGFTCPAGWVCTPPVTLPSPSPSPVPSPVPSQVPVQVGLNASLRGIQLCPASHPFHQDVSDSVKYPANPKWADYLRVVGGDVQTIGGADFSGGPMGLAYVVVPASQPMVPIKFTMYGSQSDPGPYPLPSDSSIIQYAGHPPGWTTGDRTSGDRHVMVLQYPMLYELWLAAYDPVNGWSAASGRITDMRTCADGKPNWTSANAAGTAELPVVVRQDELVAGKIDHAIGFTLSCSSASYVAPATHYAGNTPSCPPMGIRIRLRASFDCVNPKNGQWSIHFNRDEQTYCQALKTYGGFFVDNGANFQLAASPCSTCNNSQLHNLNFIHGSDFELVTP
jgi:hypothetical protein